MSLATQLRPTTFNEVVGHEKVKNILARNGRDSVILQGKAGIGKSTLAAIYADRLGLSSYREVGSEMNAEKLKLYTQNRITEPIVLILDEIQYLNKKQQQLFLDTVEKGNLVLIGTTTEYAEGAIHSGLLSRCQLLKLYPPSEADCAIALSRAVKKCSITMDMRILQKLAEDCKGDIRYGLNQLELLVRASGDSSKITEEDYAAIAYSKLSSISVEEYKSAMQKSIRGSDASAAAVYANALMEIGELEALCRRLRVIASEDIGLADPYAPIIVDSCINSALHLGLPEAKYPVLNAVIWLALQPKSNSIAITIEQLKTIEDKEIIPPNHIRYAHAKNYEYPHIYPNSWVDQEYMPMGMEGLSVYSAGGNKREQAYKEYWDKIKNK